MEGEMGEKGGVFHSHLLQLLDDIKEAKPGS